MEWDSSQNRNFLFKCARWSNLLSKSSCSLEKDWYGKQNRYQMTTIAKCCAFNETVRLDIQVESRSPGVNPCLIGWLSPSNFCPMNFLRIVLTTARLAQANCNAQQTWAMGCFVVRRVIACSKPSITGKDVKWVLYPCFYSLPNQS